MSESAARPLTRYWNQESGSFEIGEVVWDGGEGLTTWSSGEQRQNADRPRWYDPEARAAVADYDLKRFAGEDAGAPPKKLCGARAKKLRAQAAIVVQERQGGSGAAPVGEARAGCPDDGES